MRGASPDLTQRNLLFGLSRMQSRWNCDAQTTRLAAEAKTVMRALVVGGSGGIGAAFASMLAADARFSHVTNWSRSAPDLAGHRTSTRRIDLRDEATIAAAAQELGAIELVLIATGLLHDYDMKPEKTWRSLEPANPIYSPRRG